LSTRREGCWRNSSVALSTRWSFGPIHYQPRIASGANQPEPISHVGDVVSRRDVGAIEEPFATRAGQVRPGGKGGTDVFYFMGLERCGHRNGTSRVCFRAITLWLRGGSFQTRDNSCQGANAHRCSMVGHMLSSQSGRNGFNASGEWQKKLLRLRDWSARSFPTPDSEWSWRTDTRFWLISRERCGNITFVCWREIG
jgi:hypothetical protein